MAYGKIGYSFLRLRVAVSSDLVLRCKISPCNDVEGKADSKEEYDLQNQTEEQSRPPTNKETANGDGLPSDKSDLDVPGEDPSDPTGADSKGNSTGHECSPSHNVNNAERDEKSSAEEGTGQGQGPRDKTPDSNEKKDQGSSNGEQNDQDKSAEAVEEIDSGMGANHDGSNDADTGEEQKVQIDDSDEGDKAQTDNESKETQGEDANTAQDGTDSSIDTEQPGEVSGEVSAEHDEVKSEADLDADKKDPDTEKE
uniref:Uncharacterized protein n=1 Tax=Knipowitschia caucasica TaxID=637954 RepID=A0AAV2MBR1_KNICA